MRIYQKKNKDVIILEYDILMLYKYYYKYDSKYASCNVWEN